MSIAALISLLPLEVTVAAIVWMECPRSSPIYRQVRVGLNGKKFVMYKFRSMRPNAEKMLKKIRKNNEMDGPVFKMANDPRVTRFGRIIRKTGIDEIPQFINVIKGDMSIVGPRPPLPDEVKEYTKEQMARLSVKPGITCFWQIQPHRNQLSFDDWMVLDEKYIKEQGFLTDWKIMLKTINTVIHREGL